MEKAINGLQEKFDSDFSEANAVIFDTFLRD